MPAAEDQITRTTSGSGSSPTSATVTTTGNPISRLHVTLGRYMLFGQVGAGGMGAVHLGRRVGPAGFSRLVAVKRMHPHLSKEKEFIHAFLDEARIAARITHPNVVSINDVVMDGDEVLLVMEYIHGRSLSFLAYAERKRGRAVPPPVAAALALDILHGLQAAHDARDERGELLGVIHRDVSPQNVLVGADGVARLLDFGVAKALGRLQSTETGSIKGKLAYMAPERLSGRDDVQPITAAVDVYAAAMVIWEMLAGERYWAGVADDVLIGKVTSSPYRHLRDASLASIDAVLEQAMQREPQDRFSSCRDLGSAIEGTLDAASRDEVMEWVESVAGPELAESADVIAEIEQRSMPFPTPISTQSGSANVVLADDDDDDEKIPTTSPTSVVRPLALLIAAVGLTAAIILFATRSSSTTPPTTTTTVAAPTAATTIPVVSEPTTPATATATATATTTTTAAPAKADPPPPPRGARATKTVAPPSPTPSPTAPSTTAAPKRPDEEAPADRK
jgi:serine/threonine protein kinase